MTPDRLRRFWQKVQKTETCWLWTAAKTDPVYGEGYGIFWDGLRYEGAHRFAWRIEHGVIPKGFSVLHRCDTPACVRVDHLFVGTPKENNRDMERKGRARYPFGQKRPTGLLNPRAKLSPKLVSTIRTRRLAGERCIDLAAEYAVHRSTILEISSGKHWSQSSVISTEAKRPVGENTKRKRV